MKYKPLPIGIENFEKLIEQKYYYVDKTLLIQKLLDYKAEVTLFTRPRRFGKSLNLSMLQCFFEKTEKDRSHLFHGLKIEEAGNEYREHMGKYPVIMLSFKEAKQDDFSVAYYTICEAIAEEFQRHSQILNLDVMTEKEKESYTMIMNKAAEYKVMLSSVKFLTRCLERAYGEKVIVLIDEYDVPLENSHFKGFYNDMIGFIRGILSAALKTNNALEMAIMTGCLRISKESIFTGLNNPKIVSIENKMYGEYFGFTEREVADMLVYYNQQDRQEVITEWYNGYLFGVTKVYNPWSLISYMDELQSGEIERPKPYWANTSSNNIVRELLEKSDATTKIELEELMAGGIIKKQIHEDITYADIYASMDNLWNFLYFTGYLKKVSEETKDDTAYAVLQISNKEVMDIYKNHILGWVTKQIEQADFTKLYEATLTGDTATMEEEIGRILWETVSYYDTANSKAGESFYHGLLVGIYAGLKDYQMLSNRESGNGRPDFVIKGPVYKRKAYIFEFKIAEKPQKLAEAAIEALEQIEEREYKEGLLAEGYEDITVYGVGFFKKNCRVRTWERATDEK
ncbi:MAG: AAA family ATPase [Eubacteriales bacterium]